MKSLVALLDRKKRDRANTLVQVPFPSTFPYPASSQQETQVPLPGSRRTSTPSTLLRPPLQQRASSNASLSQHPLFLESPAYSRDHSPAQSTSYYTDSDDGTLADPFAAASTFAKGGLNSSGASFGVPRQLDSRGDSESNTTNLIPQSSFRFRAGQGLSPILPDTNEPASHSGAGKKGRWLRERRSLTSLLRPQPSMPIEHIPPLPSGARAPERKPSNSFFTRGRSGSTPAAHTPQKQSTPPAQARLQTAAAFQPQSADSGMKDKMLSQPVVPSAGDSPTMFATLSPDSWVRVGGVGREQGSPTSVRPRAVSVPARARPPQPTELCPPVPNGAPAPRAPTSECDHSTSTPRKSLPPLARHPKISIERYARPSHVVHGARSASVSGPTPLNAGGRSIKQGNPPLKHLKQSSMGGPEGMVLKSALKYRPTEQPVRDHQSLHLQQVQPLRISKREDIDFSQLPTPSSESSLRSLQYTTTIQQRSSTASNSGDSGNLTNTTRSIPTTGTVGSFGSVMKGHGLSTSDSRSLPVLDNIWGSFVSETALGSLPPSPVASVGPRTRTSHSLGSGARRRAYHSPASSYSSSNSSHLLPSQSQWKPGSAPPTLPPISNLPPVPARPSPALTLPLGSVTPRNRSRSIANAAMLLTPPISPTKEVEFQGLDFAVTASTSDSGVPGVSIDSSRQPPTPSRSIPRLTRSTSSPVIRSPKIPTPSPDNLRVPNTSLWLSVRVPNSRSPSPSSASQSSSQCTPVPGTPIAFPPASTGLAPTHLGKSSGLLIPPTPDLRLPRGSSQILGSGSAIASPDSVTILGMFPNVPSSQAWPQARENVEDQDEKPPLTPPVTPAWVAQVFDPDSGDSLGGLDGEALSDQDSVALSGSLAQLRRQKRHDLRSSLSEHRLGHRASVSAPPHGASAMRSNRNAV